MCLANHHWVCFLHVPCCWMLLSLEGTRRARSASLTHQNVTTHLIWVWFAIRHRARVRLVRFPLLCCLCRALLPWLLRQLRVLPCRSRTNCPGFVWGGHNAPSSSGTDLVPWASSAGRSTGAESLDPRMVRV